MIDNFIPLTVSAVSKKLDTTDKRWQNNNLTRTPGCLSVVGILGSGDTIYVQIPVVSDPDPIEDSHWTNFMQDGEAVVLTSTHNAEAIPVGIVIRVVKPATEGNLIGVRWS